MAAIVRNIQNNDLYEFLGGNRFRNLRTGREGDVDDELARKIFRINVEASRMLSDYPHIAEMISTLNLKIKHDDNGEKKPGNVEQSVPGVNTRNADRALEKNP